MNKNRSRRSGNAQRVLLITDSASFGRDVLMRWQACSYLPEFTTVSSEGSEFIGLEKLSSLAGYDLAIVGLVAGDQLRPVLRRTWNIPAILVWTPPGFSPDDLHRDFPHVLAIRESESLAESSVVLGAALLLRTDYQRKLVSLQNQVNDNKLHATLGRYMIETRPTLNNALTSVLGTAELMQLNENRPAERTRQDVKTIHMMALRIQSLVHQFSALEAELKLEQSRVSADTQMLELAMAAGPQGPMQ